MAAKGRFRPLHSRDSADLDVPGVVVNLDPSEAADFGLAEEDAMSPEDAWESLDVPEHNLPAEWAPGVLSADAKHRLDQWLGVMAKTIAAGGVIEDYQENFLFSLLPAAIQKQHAANLAKLEATEAAGYASPSNLKPPKRSSERRFLLPDRHPQQDFFVCDVVEAAVKDDLGTMEHPVFSLKKSGDTEIRRYEHNGVHIEVTPSVKGIATVWDKDILIYGISQLVAKINAGLQPHRTIRFRAYDLLVSTNRGTGGREYDLLEAALERLAGTRLKTDLRTNDQRERAGFGLIESWKILERRSDSRMDAVEVTLSEWLYRAVLGREVLTLHRDYFRLASSIDRRLYELARKHCGRQPRWQVTLEVLQKKTGSRSELREFREQIRQRAASDHLPEYHLTFDDGDLVTFTRRRETRDFAHGDGELHDDLS
jgi:hypothetical protein